MNISGKVALVTGGASGLGGATAKTLYDAGASVVVLDLESSDGEVRAKELGERARFAPADVTDETQVQAAVDLAARKLGGLHVLVNCAGVGWPGRVLTREGTPTDLERFEAVIRINLIGTYNVLRLAAAAMNSNEPDPNGERGAVVMTASIAAYDGQIGQIAYAASKGGVVGMTLPMARDLARHGIRVNTIAPGLIDTPIYGEGERAEAFKAKLGESVLFPKRLGRSDELASMVVECLTNSYMNAEVIRVDGGIRMPPK